MNKRKLAALNGVLFFCFWLLVLYAGADHPPPAGFLGLVLFIVLCALLVAWRVPAYVDWYLAHKQHALVRVLFEGLIAGLCAGLIAMLFSMSDGTFGGEPSVTPTGIAILTWFVTLGIIGLLNALFIYAANAFIANRFLDQAPGS